MDEDLIIAGPVYVALRVSSDCPDTDIVAKLVEVQVDGEERLLMDGVIRMMLRDGFPQPLEPGDPIDVAIPLGQLHHTVGIGNRPELSGVTISRLKSAKIARVSI